MKYILLCSVFFVTILSSCKKVTNTYVSLDKEVMINFPIWFWSTTSTTFETLPNYSFLIDFDKRDYVSVDSIVLIAGLRTDNSSNAVDVRLFNLTDNIEIANSNLTTTATGAYAVLQSKNIFGSLPDKRITLGMQLKSSTGTTYVYVIEQYLKLRRK
jgi:hypothetical protein